MSEWRALTLWQIYASLVAIGAKRIETRSWQTSYRGPLLIHAAARRPTHKESRIGPYRARAFGSYAGGGYALEGPGLPEYRSTPRLEGYLLPYRAVVATCTLVDVVPIVGGDDVYLDRNGCRTGKRGFVFVRSDRECLERYRWNGLQYEQMLTEDTTAQLPYGDFTPGRFAWLLADVRALPEPVKANGRQGLRTPDPEVVEAVERQLAAA